MKHLEQRGPEVCTVDGEGRWGKETIVRQISQVPLCYVCETRQVVRKG